MKSEKKDATAKKLSRRNFLQRTTAATAAAVGIPMIIPASARGADGHVAPSNRIVMASIGVGSQGTGDMGDLIKIKGVQYVAVCDVDADHRKNAQNKVNEFYGNQDCKEYTDFRELLERKDLDAVALALPDHWHSIPAIMAANRGLHMYAEKPLALTIAEGRAIVNAVKKNKVIWQTGSWQRSQINFQRGCEIVRSGAIGKVHTVKVGLPTGQKIDMKEPQGEMPIPPGFDYDFWLGPAPYAPYNKNRCHWNFRWILDYSGGQLTDWVGHHGDIANWGMGTEHTGPESIKAHGEFPREGLWNTAIHYNIECKYGKGASPVSPDGFTMLLADGATFPMGTRFEGTDGWVFVDRGGRTGKLETYPESLKTADLGPKAVHLYDSAYNHFQNFADCVRSKKQAIAPVEPAHRAISLGHLGNISMRLGGCELKWNPKTEQFINDTTADRMLERAMRGTWHLPA
ncbi:MAG: Gfo/Idh/MocA family oxidoreductase [Candidatus Hydrogenedentes bacterium]|nr:Gfo/Idh/MocA family oxidoreductase [Candidatus Hydrogenedentota bacterium]